MLLQKEILEQQHLHLVQIVESEKTERWYYTQQCEELNDEIKKLRTEVSNIDLDVVWATAQLISSALSIYEDFQTLLNQYIMHEANG